MVKLRAQIKHLEQLLQKEIREDLKYGVNVKKRVKWPVMRLFSKKLMQNMSIWMKEEKKTSRSKHREEVHFCEPEEGSILGKDDDESDGMMECLEKQRKEMWMMSNGEGNCNVFQPNFFYCYEVLGTKYQENGAKKMPKTKEGATV